MFRHRKLVGQLTHYKFRNLKWAWFRFVPCETNSLLLNINVGEVAVRTQTRETQLDSKMNLGYCKLDTMWGKYNLLETLFRLSVVSFNVHFTFTVKKPCNISNITPCISLQQQKIPTGCPVQNIQRWIGYLRVMNASSVFLQAVKDHMHNLTPENTMNQPNLLLVRRIRILMVAVQWQILDVTTNNFIVLRADSTWLSPVHLRFPKQSLPCLRVSNQRKQLPT